MKPEECRKLGGNIKHNACVITKIDKISPKHNDSVWYDGTIARAIKDNGTELLLIAAGDIRIKNKKGDLVYDGKERDEGIEGGFEDDRDLKKIGSNYSDNYFWENNNWFEVLYKTKKMKAFDGIMGDVAYDYDGGMKLLDDYINKEPE